MSIIDWVKEGWIILAGIIGGITLIWNFLNKTVKEIKNEWGKPITQINEKMQGIVEKLDLIEKSAEIRKRALLSMQRKSLLDSCKHYITRGYISLEEKDTIHNQFKSYEELGGNSFIKGLVSDVENLPIEKPAKQKKSKHKVESELV